ncbi:MAG: VTT domain-containing protein [bacterium]|nr:VTT domain-containing protein [bacterium]
MLEEDIKQVEKVVQTHTEVVRNLAFIAVSIGAAYVVIVTIGVDRLREVVASAGILGPIAIVLVKMSTIIIVPLGGGPVYAIAGAVFGFWNGLLLTLIGDVLGFSAAFYISRLWGRSVVQFFVPKAQWSTVENILVRGSQLRPFIKARIAFVALPEVFAYTAGLSTVSFLAFLPVQMIPHIPTMILVVFFGDALLAGNPLYFVSVTVLAAVFMVCGGLWFHRDVTRAA